jgi:hypothetical protein
MSRNLARTGAAVGILATLAVGTTAAMAGTPVDDAEKVTGCLVTSGTNVGKLVALKPGLAPLRACTANEQQTRVSGGDLTSFRAGPGLANTSTSQYLGLTGSGDVSVELQPSYRLPQQCPADSGARWTGTAWVCATPRTAEPRPIQFTAGRYLDGASTTVGNDWATVGSFDVPAGSWEFSSRVSYLDSTGDVSVMHCRLDVTGKTYVDEIQMNDVDITQTGELTLSAFHTSATPFRAATVCRDSPDGSSAHETGMRWETVRMHARPSQPVVDVSP